MAEQRKEDFKTLLTPIANLMWVKINGNEDEFNGKSTGTYSAGLYNIPDEEAKTLQKELLDFWNASEFKKEVEEEYGEADSPNLGIKLGKGKKSERGWFLTARTVARFTDKNGNIKERTVRVFDGIGNRLDDEISIWNGSTGRLNIFVKPYKMSENNYGLTLKLQDIQVVNLVTNSSGSDTKNPFTTVEGAEAYISITGDTDFDNVVSNSEIPF